ncbi:MAG: S-layer homology domain-containing protein [Symbiobacteriia bacterium]
MKRIVAGVIIFTLLGVLLAPAGTALAGTGGSFSISQDWVWTNEAPVIHLWLQPPAGMTRVAVAAGANISQPPTFRNEDFMTIADDDIVFQASPQFIAYDGLIKVWVQYADASGIRSDVIERTVPAYAWLFFQMQDAGKAVDALFSDPAGKDKVLTVRLNLGSHGQEALPVGQWAVSLTNPATNEVLTFPVDSGTRTGQMTVPGRFLLQAQDLKMAALLDGDSVFHRNLKVNDPSAKGMIRVSAANLTGHTVAWLAATNVKTIDLYLNDNTQLPSTITVPPGTYRLEAQIMNDGADEWVLFSSTNVTVQAGQIVDAPALDANATVPLTTTTTATYQGAPLDPVQVQLRPAGTLGRAGVHVETGWPMKVRVTPGVYDVLYALAEPTGKAPNHVFMLQQHGIDITKGLNIAEDFSAPKHGVLHITAVDGQNRPASLQFYLNKDYDVEWDAAAPGGTFVHLPYGDYDGWMLIGGATGAGPRFWEYKKFSISGDQTMNLGGPLRMELGGRDAQPGKTATIQTRFYDQFGNAIRSAWYANMTITLKGVHGEVIASKQTSSIWDNTIDVPASAPSAIRIIPQLEATGYQDLPIKSELILGANVFDDVEPLSWADTDITVMAARGVVKGTSSMTFNPTGTVTRAEFATFLVRALDLQQEPSGGRFTDVVATVWYDGFVGAAAKAQLTREAEGVFRPTDHITREEMADMMARALAYKGKAPSLTRLQVDAVLSSFSDASSIDGWAREALAGAAQVGLLKGRSGGQVAPLATATRAEAVVILKRLLEYTGDL